MNQRLFRKWYLPLPGLILSTALRARTPPKLSVLVMLKVTDKGTPPDVLRAGHWAGSFQLINI